MSQYVERVVNISYNAEKIRFETDEQMNTFYLALGYMVAYAMAGDRPRNLELVNLSIDRNLEITCAYFPPWQRGETYTENKIQYDLDNALTPLRDGRDGRPFVMGAVPRDGGKTYSFHS
jgi:hypothetical protein